MNGEIYSEQIIIVFLFSCQYNEGMESINYSEIEEQRPGRNKETLVNHTYINSGSYRNKFDLITSNTQLSRLLYGLAKEMLFHRAGTKYEDMYWIDANTFEIVAKETECPIEKKIIYSDKTIKAIEGRTDLITVHSHPDSFPPSIDDINANFDHNYMVGIVLCHNGKVYLYSANESIEVRYYNMVVERFLKQGYNEDEAQIATLQRLQENFDITFKEVTDYDV